MNTRLLFASLVAGAAVLACTDGTAPIGELPVAQTPVASGAAPHFLKWDQSKGPVAFASVGADAESGIAFRSGAPAAIAVDRSSSVTASTSSLTWSHTVGGGTNRLLVVGVSIRNGGKTVTGVTYGDAPLSFLGARNNHDNAVRVELWYLLGPPMGTADVTVSLSGGAKVVGGATSFTGVDQAAPFSSFVSEASIDKGTTHPTVTIASAGNELVISAVATEGDAVTMTPEGPGQTQRWEEFYGSSGGDVAGAGSTLPGASSVTVRWKTKTVKWAVGAVALKPAPAPGPTLDQYEVSFWAVRGQLHTVQINYLDAGVPAPFVQFNVSDPLQRPDGNSMAIGDSVRITLAVDPLELMVHFEPSGLQFGTAAELQMWYTGANHDFNDDGVIDSSDAYIQENLLGVWYQEGSSNPWQTIFSEHDVVTERFQAYLEHFSGYAISW